MIVALGLLALILLISIREVADFSRGVTRLYVFSNSKVALEYERTSKPRAFWLFNALKLIVLGLLAFGAFTMLVSQ